MAEEPFSFDDQTQKQLDPYHWAKRKALKLFEELRDVLGDDRARRVFELLGTPPTASRLNEIENMSIIDRLDMMPGGPNVKELARQIAGEKCNNPTPEEIATIE